MNGKPPGIRGSLGHIKADGWVLIFKGHPFLRIQRQRSINFTRQSKVSWWISSAATLSSTLLLADQGCANIQFRDAIGRQLNPIPQLISRWKSQFSSGWIPLNQFGLIQTGVFFVFCFAFCTEERVRSIKLRSAQFRPQIKLDRLAKSDRIGPDSCGQDSHMC